jgi:hypothetical protein
MKRSAPIRIIYVLCATYLLIRIITGLVTYIASGMLHDLALGLNAKILNNLGFLILPLFGLANGLLLNLKFNSKSNKLMRIVYIAAGILLTLLSAFTIWISTFFIF